MGDHLINGEFQSDKYPTTPRGKVPLSCKDPMAQDLLWEYAQRRRAVDAGFSVDLEAALKLAGYASAFVSPPADPNHTRDQVAAQCKVVAHLARAIAGVHADYERLMASGRSDQLLDQVGRRTASFMERLGNMLNAMDAASEDDAWVDPIFEEAQRLWPAQAAE